MTGARGACRVQGQWDQIRISGKIVGFPEPNEGWTGAGSCRHLRRQAPGICKRNVQKSHWHFAICSSAFVAIDQIFEEGAPSTLGPMRACDEKASGETSDPKSEGVRVRCDREVGAAVLLRATPSTISLSSRCDTARAPPSSTMGVTSICIRHGRAPGTSIAFLHVASSFGMIRKRIVLRARARACFRWRYASVPNVESQNGMFCRMSVFFFLTSLWRCFVSSMCTKTPQLVAMHCHSPYSHVLNKECLLPEPGKLAKADRFESSVVGPNVKTLPLQHFIFGPQPGTDCRRHVWAISIR